MQAFVFPTVFYIWKVLLICRGGYYPPASKDTNIVIEINYINITKLLLFCRGEPCSPVRVQRTRLHALRAKLNTQFMLYQNILYKHKYSSSGRMISSRLKYSRNALYINVLPFARYFRQRFAPFIRHRRRSQGYPYGFVTFIKIIFNKNILPLLAGG